MKSDQINVAIYRKDSKYLDSIVNKMELKGKATVISKMIKLMKKMKWEKEL